MIFIGAIAISEETKGNGLTLIVDARLGAWRVARTCIRLSTNLIGFKDVSVIVVRPDGFWDKRVDSCTKSHKEGEVGTFFRENLLLVIASRVNLFRPPRLFQPTYVTLTKLHVCIDFSQLPYELAGNKAYDHVEWITKRMVNQILYQILYIVVDLKIKVARQVLIFLITQKNFHSNRT